MAVLESEIDKSFVEKSREKKVVEALNGLKGRGHVVSFVATGEAISSAKFHKRKGIDFYIVCVRGRGCYSVIRVSITGKSGNGVLALPVNYYDNVKTIQRKVLHSLLAS